jgi:hypothetical protein
MFKLAYIIFDQQNLLSVKNLKSIIETISSELYIISDELFTLNNVDEILEQIIIYSEKYNKKFRIRVDNKIEKYLDRLNKNITLEFDLKKVLNFERFFFTQLIQYGISYYYFLIVENLEDLNFNVKENPIYLFITISKKKSFNSEESSFLFNKLSDLENKDINVITDKDTYFSDSQNFDCNHYSNESITIMGDGTVILCPEFRILSDFKKSFVNLGNLFEIGIDRIISHLQSVKILNMLVIKNRTDLGECKKCLGYIRKI